MFVRWAAVAALLGILCGCGATVESFPVTAPAGPAEQARPGSSAGSRLSTRVVVLEPSESSARYRTMAVVNPYTSADVDHLKFELWRVDPGGDVLQGTTQTPSGSGVGKTVDWSHLRKNTGYKLKVLAMSASGQILNAGGTATVKEFTTGEDDLLATSVSITLAERVFAGKLHPVVVASTINASHVNYLKLELQESAGGSWVSRTTGSTPGGSGMSKTIDFENLKRNTTYRVIVTAIRSNGNALKTATVNCPIGTDDDVTVTVNL